MCDRNAAEEILKKFWEDQSSVSIDDVELISCRDCGNILDPTCDGFGTTHGWCGECEEIE